MGMINGTPPGRGPIAAWDEYGAHVRMLGRIGRGGQGQVWSTADGRAAKFPRDVDGDDLAALRTVPVEAFVDGRTGHRWAVWPQSLMFAQPDGASPIGYVMPFAGGKSLLSYHGAKARALAGITCTPRFVVRVAMHLASGCWWCESKAGVVPIDLHPGNVLVDPRTARCTILDPDGMSIKGRQQRLALADYAAPEQLRGDTGDARASSCWALAIALTQILLDGLHPFGGVPINDDGPEQTPATNIRAGWSWLSRPEGGIPPSPIAPSAVLGDDLMTLVERAFTRGRDEPEHRPPAEDWALAIAAYDQRLVPCRSGVHLRLPEHDACPWCMAVDALRAAA